MCALESGKRKRGLYLTVFEEDDESDGVEGGSYGDFGRFPGLRWENPI